MLYLSGHNILTDNDLQFQRNLLKNSSNIVVDINHKYSTATASNMFAMFPLTGTAKQGERITISVDSLDLTTDDKFSVGLWSTTIVQYGAENGVLSNSQKQVTLEVAKDTSNPAIIIWAGEINQGKINENSSVRLKKVMVQKGTIATMWLPAPEDLGLATQSDLDDLKAQIEQLKSK